jgi:Xaa-Pro dipeptidase
MDCFLIVLLNMCFWTTRMLLNKVRAVEYMRRCGLDAVVATSPVNITYFSGYYCWLDSLFKDYMMVPGAPAHTAQRYALLTADGEVSLVVNPQFAVNAADLGINDLHFFGGTGLDFSLEAQGLPEQVRGLYDQLHSPIPNANPTEALLNIIKTRGLARIGVEMEGLTPPARDELLRHLPNAKDCSNLIRLIRMVKSEEEIRRLTRAAEISEIAAMEALALPQRNAGDMVQHYRARTAGLGADFDHFAYGMYGMGIATEPAHIFNTDSVEYVDFGVRYQYYFSDSGTTLAYAELPLPLESRYAALQACMDAGKRQLRPDVKASTVQAAMQQTLKERGITASFPHGHGVGLEVRDYPIIVPDSGLRIHDDCVDVPADLPLEANMVVNLEAPLFMAGVGSLHIEETYLITADGYQPLVAQERSRVFIPATVAG